MKIKSIKSKPIVSSREDELMVFGADDEGAGAIQKYDETIANQLSGSAFLPRLQLLTGNSDKCKSNEFPVNKFALISGQKYTDIGAAVNVLVLVWRPKAIDTKSDEMIVVHDVTEPEFERIKEQSKEKDSGCMYGQEFLIWIPEIEQFATFFMGTPTSRREAPNMLALLMKAATLKPEKIKTKRYTYFSPGVTVCTATFALPDKAECLAQIKDFNNPKAVQVQRVEKEPSGGAADPRG